VIERSIVEFARQRDSEAWLGRHHATSPGVWLLQRHETLH
jgi:hypothetical protein